jgi:hypothetical protein
MRRNCRATCIPVCVGFFVASPVKEKLGLFRHFPPRLSNGFVPQITRRQGDAEMTVAPQWRQAIDYE